MLAIEPAFGVPEAYLHLASLYNNNAIHWPATVSDPWLQLSQTSGTTPHSIAVSVDESALADGFYEASITLANSDNAADSIIIPVYITIAPYNLYLPVIVAAP
ncbi:MAG: BACON domain-containing protein [Chloroflexi bacterium]|nr:BACON domain-containing protein [Chloroflexota bacterium]